MAGFLKVEIDANVTNFVAQFAEGLDNAIRFGSQQARLYLKNEGLPQAIFRMGSSAGAGFPHSYTNHLAIAMHSCPLEITHLGEGILEVTLDIEPLGNYEDLLRGAHHNAMTVDNDDGDFKSFRKSTRSLIRRVQLPYQGEDLLNSQERRLQWWNDAIVGRNFQTMVGANWNWTKPSVRTDADAWNADNVPTFEQVASARVNEAWRPLGVAPEWTLLEFGTPEGSEPSITPQNFRENIRQLMGCVCTEAISSAVIAFKRLLEERQVVGVKGPQASPYNTLGQFVEYKDLLITSAPNLSNCLALI